MPSAQRHSSVGGADKQVVEKERLLGSIGAGYGESYHPSVREGGSGTLMSCDVKQNTK